MNRQSNNILITGSDGQLGCELRELLSDRGIAKQKGWKIFYADIAELDITDRAAVFTFIRNNEIDIVVNCAAYTAVDNAEDEHELSFRINGEAPGYLAEALAQKSADNDYNRCTPFIVHISTDYVFDGTSSTPYREDSATNPQTIYGESKLAGENRVAGSGVNYVIIRTSWLYSKYGKNFVETILKLSVERSELNVVYDQTGTPTNAADLAGAIIEIIAQNVNVIKSGIHTHNNIVSTSISIESVNKYGIYHYSNEGICSWYQFAKEIVKLFGRECNVNPVTTDKFPAKAKRPAYSVLDKGKIKYIYGIDIPDWRDSLAKYMAIRHKI
jgi:dTDP-4-dehydrorhamnose reductase